MFDEPVEPLPEPIEAARKVADMRAEQFAWTHGSVRCHQCSNRDLSFCEPWAECKDCGWIEGY